MIEKLKIDWKAGDHAIVKDGWDRAGTVFRVLGPAVFLEQWWIPIEDPDEEDPTFFKESGLEKLSKKINLTCMDCKHRTVENIYLNSICSRCKNRNNHEKLEWNQF